MDAKRALIALTVVGGLFRFGTLDLQSYWLDEAATVELVTLDLSGMLHRVPDSESSPPLYYVLAWLWTQVFGSGEVGLRSLSALFGTASIPVAYAAAAELCSRRVGLIVAALAAVSPVLVWYSQEARAYSLLILLGGLSLWSFARLLNRPSGTAAAAWAVSSALALATHYFAAFLVLPEAVWLAAVPAARRRALPAQACVAATAAALLPLALHQRSLGLATFIADESLALRLARAAKGFLLGFESPLEVALTVLASAVAGIAALAGVRLARRAGDRGVRKAAVIGGAAVAVPLLLALVDVDYFDTRNLLAAWLPLMVVVGGGLAAHRIGLAGLAVLCAAGLASVVGVALEPTWQRDDWRGMAEALGPADAPRVLVVQPASGRRPLGVYLDELSPLPDRGRRVAELASVYPVRRGMGGAHPAPPPRGGAAPLAGFSLGRPRLSDTYSIFPQRAPAPQPIAPVQARGLVLVAGEPFAVLLQRP
ncbi:MAG TPA: glycosyltransferase family 39 protein [Thermoleophilaceae bacterium]|nr:glycosyltransferase family 39 protein [Thermoleophilaceae bacterium]